MPGEVGPLGDAGTKGEAVGDNDWCDFIHVLTLHRLDCSICVIACVLLTKESARVGGQARWGTVWGRLGVFSKFVVFPTLWGSSLRKRSLRARATALILVVFITFHAVFNSLLLFCFSRVIQELPGCQVETESQECEWVTQLRLNSLNPVMTCTLVESDLFVPVRLLAGVIFVSSDKLSSPLSSPLVYPEDNFRCGWRNESSWLHLLGQLDSIKEVTLLIIP